jgi:hypothetical protein
VTGGGPLSNEVGDALVRAGCTLRTAYGGTEIGTHTCWCLDPRVPAPARSEWAWMAFGKDACARWVPQEGSDVVELQLLSTARQVTAVENLPDGPGYSTKDLFIRHPSQPGLWKMCAAASRVWAGN